MKKLMSLAALFVMCALAAATTIVPLSVNELTRYSSDVVEAQAVSAYSEWNPQHTLIFTYTTFSVERALKGQAPQSITVKQIGGQIGKDSVRVAGVRYFHAGDRSVLFLQQSADGTYGITGMIQGDFRIRREMSGEEFASNGIVGPGVHTLGEGSSAEVYSGGRFRVSELESAVKEMSK